MKNPDHYERMGVPIFHGVSAAHHPTDRAAGWGHQHSTGLHSSMQLAAMSLLPTTATPHTQEDADVGDDGGGGAAAVLGSVRLCVPCRLGCCK